MNHTYIIAGAHLQATADGVVRVRVSGRGPAVITLRSVWRVSPRWLGSGRPRYVRFGLRRVTLRPDAVTIVAFRLSREHLALLRRMQTVHVAVRVRTDDDVVTRRVELHAPGRRSPRTRMVRETADQVCGEARTTGGVRSDMLKV